MIYVSHRVIEKIFMLFMLRKLSGFSLQTKLYIVNSIRIHLNNLVKTMYGYIYKKRTLLNPLVKIDVTSFSFLTTKLKRKKNTLYFINQ